MRRVLLTFVFFALFACGGDDRNSPEFAARVGSWTLSADRLAEILVLAQPYPLEAEQVTPMVRHWVEMAAFSIRTAGGESFLEKELVLQTRWNEVRDAILAQFNAEHFGAQNLVRPEDVDGLYFGDEVRAVAHMFRRAGPDAPEDVRRDQFTEATRIRAQLVEGAPWSLANEANQEVESQQRGGLMLVRKGQGSPQINEVAFALRPGELSRVFASPDGFHLLVRPRLEEVRGAFAGLLTEDNIAAAEAAFVENLGEEKGLTLAADAAGILRRVTADPTGEVGSQDVLAEFEGGRLTAGQAARFLHFLPVGIRPEILDGPDWGVEDFARQLGLSELIWTHVQGLEYELSPDEYDLIRDGYEADLNALWSALEVNADSVAADGGTLDQREASVRRKLDLYLESVVARTRTLQTPPPFLVLALLEETEWAIDPAGIQAALDTAQRLLDLAGYEEVG